MNASFAVRKPQVFAVPIGSQMMLRRKSRRTKEEER
jgi:hypothetical protein